MQVMMQKLFITKLITAIKTANAKKIINLPQQAISTENQHNFGIIEYYVENSVTYIGNVTSRGGFPQIKPNIQC
jgi:hypothetical protein